MIVRSTTSHTTGNWIRPFGPIIYTNTTSKMMVDEINYFAKNSKTKYNNNKNLAGNIEQEWAYEMSDQFKKELESFVFDYNDILEEQLGKLPNGKPSIHIHDPWVNVQKKGEWNPVHTHGADFSCVLYSKIPEELKNEWMHPNQQGNYPTAGKIEFGYGEDLSASRCYMLIKPHEGQFILFPSWLRHHVYPFNSDVERISFSTNFTLQY